MRQGRAAGQQGAGLRASNPGIVPACSCVSHPGVHAAVLDPGGGDGAAPLGLCGFFILGLEGQCFGEGGSLLSSQLFLVSFGGFTHLAAHLPAPLRRAMSQISLRPPVPLPASRLLLAREPYPRACFSAPKCFPRIVHSSVMPVWTVCLRRCHLLISLYCVSNKFLEIIPGFVLSLTGMGAQL